MYNHPNGEMIYTHEGLCYTVEYEWYPSDGPGFDESIEVRITRGGRVVKLPPRLESKIEGAALRHARLYECGLCPEPDPAPPPPSRPAQPPPPPAPKAGSRRAQIFSISPADRR